MSESKLKQAAENVINNIKESVEEIGSGIKEAIIDEQQPFKMPSKDELLSMIDEMGLSEDEANELRAALMDNGNPYKQPWTTQALILLSFILLVALFFSYMFYRIYKSQKGKQDKREEKIKLKLFRRRKNK